MTSSDGELGFVVNFFCSSTDAATRELLAATTGVSLRFIRLNPLVDTTVLIDGSADPVLEMKAICNEIGVEYVHAGRQLNYVEAYNLGWRRLQTKYIGMLANDVIPHPFETIALLLDWIRRPDVGCVFPYLNSNRRSFDEVQRPGFLHRGRFTCEPASMTLNLNIFKRSVLEEIGELDENYEVGYQEPILLIKIRSLGHRVVLVADTRAMHYDRLTKTTGASETSDSKYRSDTDRWLAEYPGYANTNGVANIRFSAWPFSTTPMLKAAWWLTERLPGARFRHRVSELLMWIEPLLCRYPARNGKAGAYGELARR